MSLKDAHIVVREELNRVQKALYESETKTQELRRRLTYLSGIIVTLRDEICPSCKGYGQEWVVHDQDDIKQEICSVCKGTGLPTRRA